MSHSSQSPHLDGQILDELARRGITQAMHFTTRRGLVGILSTRQLQARAHLKVDHYLEHIYRPNAHVRHEEEQFFRYVNLSVSVLNERFFAISRTWHATEDDLFWAVLHVDPEVLAHPGVLFAPGNMAYEGVQPREGREGLDGLFADPYYYGFSKYRPRTPGRPTHLPSNPQAEALYPDRIPTRYLSRIVVATEEHAASVYGIVSAVDHPEVEVTVDDGLLGL